MQIRFDLFLAYLFTNIYQICFSTAHYVWRLTKLTKTRYLNACAKIVIIATSAKKCILCDNNKGR